MTQTASKRRILLIDDDETVFVLLAPRLSDKYVIDYLACPEDILSWVRTTHPDLIICDIDMPEISGGEICRTLSESEDCREIPFLYLTSYVSPAEVKKWHGAVGGRDGISKCAPPLAIVSQIDDYVALHCH